MTAAVMGAVLLACGASYLVGHAFVAPRDSFMRTTAGGALGAGCVLFALGGPPMAVRVAASLGDATVDALWGTALRSIWLVLVAIGLLVGMRVWRLRLLTEGRGALRFDESVPGRVESQLPLASSLADALDVLARERVAMKHLPRLGPSIKHLGAHYFYQLPERESELYALVSTHTGAEIAAGVTGLLLEGAGRRR